LNKTLKIAEYSCLEKMSESSVSKESIEFLKNRFSDYYRNNKIILPDRFGRREYAFVFFSGKGMMRHLGFEKKNQFNQFIIKNVPMHAYYSSAYYKKPDASTMQEKEWMGAELIFDLDSDHLPDADKLEYSKQLELVKKEFYKLVSDFLIGDFGFHDKYIELYFSGGRGYHCHVKDPEIFCLDSSERREIVDYITGRDIIDSLVFHEKITGTRSYGRRSFPSGKSLSMPLPDSPGWKGRISRGIIDIIQEIKKSDNPLEKLQEYGVKKSDAERLLEDLSDERIERIKEGRLDQSKTIRKFFLNNALRKTAVTISAGETDEPVTCDVKRLIRLPGSLHGKTGLKVIKINLENLLDFNPLSDAVVLPDKTVEVEVKKTLNLEMKNKIFKLDEGTHKVPTYLAVLLIGRGFGNII
jgi:DNA primase small subunit